MSELFTHEDPSRFLFLNDLILGPIFIFIIVVYAKGYIKNKKNPVYQKYFMYALGIRIISAILMALIYQYYYKGGDTLTYFTYVQRIRSIFFESKSDFFSIIMNAPNNQFMIDRFFESGSAFFVNESSNILIRIALFLSYPLFNTYILISFAFTIFCFYGCWKIFILFQEMYPHLEKEFALACLFLPSVCFWGTGILKDPICLGALGALTYHIYKLFFERTKITKRIILIVICFWLLLKIKIYIILSFMPAYSFWIIFRYKETIKSNFIRTTMSPIIFLISLTIGAAVLFKIASHSDRYALESIMRTAKDTQNWLYFSSQNGGSGYSLGNIEYTPIGMLKIFPKAVNVALFRPYIWEAKKPILLPAALEGLASLFLTIRLLYKAGFIRFFKLVLTNPEVQFCMVFSMIFAFAVGFTSYNFGSLVRYKIPFMPFYFIALFILADKEKIPEIIKSKIPKKIKITPKNLTVS